MTSSRRSAAEGTPVLLPLFLITLPRTPKSQDIFKLKSRCYTAIKVEAYKAQNGLTQYYNCQKFGNVWANCRQSPRCLWCGGGHLHKECPEKRNMESTSACCNCKLLEGEKPREPTGAAATRRTRCGNVNRREHPRQQREGCSHPITRSQVCPSRRR
jgi:hypothetical protein